ncbi:hypothetical protein [Paraburkholderia flagellata]|uniref:hypothetical protein n=1 Tax=Paraburkholderia flagellata TaxID=2883241 RepID=UPI001F37CE5C|nr:hypothetical protein [Paraburkholderia flagellata]
MNCLFKAIVVAAPLVLGACAGTSLPMSAAPAPAPVQAHAPAPLPAAHAAPTFKGEQVLLDPSSVVRNGRGVYFLALDGKRTVRVNFDCPSHTGSYREDGVFRTFALDFEPRFKKASMEACGELPMPEPLPDAQKRLVNPNPTKADEERAHRDFFCGSFSAMPLGQKLDLIESAKTNPKLRKDIEPCMRAMRASSYE